MRGREWQGWKRLRWGCRGRPLQQTPPAHTHTHPRRAGVDVSLKASHLHSEGRGLAEAADGGGVSQSPCCPCCPHLTRPPEPPCGAGRDLVPPSTRAPHSTPSCPPSLARTELACVQGPPPASPNPSSRGPQPYGCQTSFCFPGACLLGGTLSLRSPLSCSPPVSASPPLLFSCKAS